MVNMNVFGIERVATQVACTIVRVEHGAPLIETNSVLIFEIMIPHHLRIRPLICEPCFCVTRVLAPLLHVGAILCALALQRGRLLLGRGLRFMPITRTTGRAGLRAVTPASASLGARRALHVSSASAAVLADVLAGRVLTAGAISGAWFPPFGLRHASHRTT
jgi:hypothetical protein